VSPGLVLGALFVLIGAQVASLVQPRPRYLVAVLLAVIGFVGGELFAIAVRAGGPPLAGLHPIADAIGIAVAEAASALLAPVRRGP
jgi:hypothetical protein